MPAVPARGGEQRTTNGCWTCRLRKLKCDESPTECRECSRHGIPCDGYGEKPGWKDGGIREAEKLGAVKRQIAQRRKSMRRHRDCEPLTKSDNEAQLPFASMLRGPGDVVVLDQEHENLSASPDFRFSPSSEIQLSTEGAPVAPIRSPQKTSKREDELLMYYLDLIFPLQFRHHKYAATFSSRSWLFSLVKRIKPLHHSVLSLSTLHQHTLNQQNSYGSPQDSILEELTDHHSSTLSELRRFIHNQTNDSLTDNHVPILACCVQLVSFDLFQGGNTKWQMHLQAATTLMKANLGNMPPHSPVERRFYEDKASNFYSGAILWFDILASASTGKKPALYTSHARLLNSRPPLINLESLTGCENSIMVLIGELAALVDSKTDSLSRGQLSIWLLAEKARWILDSLEREISRLDEIYRLRTAAPGLSEPQAGQDLDVNIVTNIFACAAVVHIHQVVCGFYPLLPEIRSSIARTIVAMQRIRDGDVGQLARSLVWPCCVAGCLADEEQQVFFRGFLQAGSADAHGFGNCQTATEVLEMCWGRRAGRAARGEVGGEEWDLRRAMDELGYLLLLV